MPDDSQPPVFHDDAAPWRATPSGNIGGVVAVGLLLLPAGLTELGAIALFDGKLQLFGLFLFPLGLSWLIVSTIRVAKLLRA